MKRHELEGVVIERARDVVEVLDEGRLTEFPNALAGLRAAIDALDDHDDEHGSES